jgi:hypothetical protein
MLKIPDNALHWKSDRENRTADCDFSFTSYVGRARERRERVMRRVSYRGNWDDVNAGKESYRSVVIQCDEITGKRKAEV